MNKSKSIPTTSYQRRKHARALLDRAPTAEHYSRAYELKRRLEHMRPALEGHEDELALDYCIAQALAMTRAQRIDMYDEGLRNIRNHVYKLLGLPTR